MIVQLVQKLNLQTASYMLQFRESLNFRLRNWERTLVLRASLRAGVLCSCFPLGLRHHALYGKLLKVFFCAKSLDLGSESSETSGWGESKRNLCFTL